MQWWLVNLSILIYLSSGVLGDYDYRDIDLKNGLACEGSDLKLECEIDEVVLPQGAYYGRYSSVVCNPDHENFPPDCAINVTDRIKHMCRDLKSVCAIPASDVLFTDPCNGATNALEVNFYCIKKSVIQTTTKPTEFESITKEQIIAKTTSNFKINDEIKTKIKTTPIAKQTTSTTKTTTNIITKKIKNYNPSVNKLNNIIKEEANRTKINVENVKNILEFVKQKSIDLDINDSKEKSSQVLIDTASILLDKSATWKELNKKERKKTATLLMDSIEKEIFTVSEKNAEDIEDIQINTTRIVAELKLNKELKTELKFPTNEQLTVKESVFIKVKEPKMDQKFLFMVYNDINDLLADVNNKNDKKAKHDEYDEKLINTNIISFKIDDENLKYLNESPVELTFTHLNNEYSNNPICSYWYYDSETYEGEWKTDGCSIKSTNQSHTICSCTHLTHFAVLMDVHGAFERIESVHTLILTVITIVCSITSIISIILTILAFRYLRIVKRPRENLTTKDLTRITTHLCVCLLLSLFVFLLGILANIFKLKVYCSIIAILSHYFFLCSFFWMLLEGVQLYLMLIKIFSLDRSPVSKFCIIAYGVPFLIVTISVVFNYFKLNQRGYGTVAHCWLSSYHGFNLSFIIPVSIILTANLVILVIVMHAMRNTVTTRKTYLNHSKKQEKFYKSLLTSGFLVMTLLGLPWILGYFIIDAEKTLIFSYIFTIINSSQGTIIFFFHCILSKGVRDELLRFICNNKDTISSGTSKSNTTSKTSNNHLIQKGNMTRLSCSSSSRIRHDHIDLNNANKKLNKKENKSKVLYQLLCCMNKKGLYELNCNLNGTSTSNKNDSNNLNSNSNSTSGGDNSTLLTPPHLHSAEIPLIEDESNSKLLVYDTNDVNYRQIKNPLHYHPYHKDHTLPKRSSSHVSSNSSNSNRTHTTYVSPLASGTSVIVPASQTPTSTLPLLVYTTTNPLQLKQTTYTYYLIPRSNSNNDQTNTFKYILPANVNDTINNYANHVPTQKQAPNFKQQQQQPITNNTVEEHNYSLIESEFQTDLQYYCDEPVCSNIEDDLNINNYMEVPNQYDELDDMKILASSSSSLSSLSITKPIKNFNNKNENNNKPVTNQFTIPKTASIITQNTFKKS